MAGIQQGPSLLDRLGVRHVINGRSWVTILGGSIMPPEVLQAMVEASQCYLDMHELNKKAGEVIAKHTGAEAGLVTAGAAAGMLLQAAACMAGSNPARIAQLPDTTGMRNEIVVHRSHRVGFLQAYRMAGARLVEIGDQRGASADELEAAINLRTAAVAYIFGPWLHATLSLPQVLEIAHSKGVPVIVDASAMLPPAENLTKYIAQGADMVTFSGGKGLQGPQSTGILCGRADLIEAARLSMSPNGGVGRPTKVCKEEIVGLIAALERFVRLDHKAQWQKWRSMSQSIVDALIEIPGLRVTIEESDDRQGPTTVIYFQASWRGPSSKEVQEALTRGEPPIHVGRGGYKDELWVTPVTLQDGEEHIVARRLREELTRSR